MKQQALERIQALLEDHPEPQLLFEGNTLAGINACARGLLPKSQVGDQAEAVFGKAVLAFESFSGGDAMLFSAEVGGTQVEVKLTPYQKKYRLATLIPTQETLYTGAMRAIAESLGTPLTTVQVAKTKLFPVLEQSGDAGALAWAARMNQGIYSIMRIVSNLRLLGDTGALRNSYKQRTNLGEWMEQLVQRLEPLVQEAQRELAVELPTQDVLCNINGDLLQRALLNVISNSIKYTEPGGKILLRVKRKGSGHIQISVQDDGCGISGEAIKTLEQIFSLGPQISDSRSGTGLGLYMAKKIMADHGGDLFLEWKKNQGTIVYLLLDTVSQQPQELEVRLRSPIMDSYSGYDPLLQELADVLPSSVFDLRGVD